jgi:hypothetical protein
MNVTAAPARAGLTDPCGPCSIIPGLITHGGRSASGAADPMTAYSVEIHNLGGDPTSNSLVGLDFSQCPGIRICNSQPDPAARMNYLCTIGRLDKLADQNGRATFKVVGSASWIPGATCPEYGSFRIYADGVLVGHGTVVTTDLDGSGGVGPADLSIWLDLFFSGSNCSLGDYDGSGQLGPSDLSKWLEFNFAGNSAQSCAGTFCP